MSKPFFTALSILILLMGFQNCGDSSFQNLETVNGEPLSSLIPEDTKYTGGQNFRMLSLDIGSSDLETEFKVSRGFEDNYIIQNLNILSNCDLSDPNAAEEILQIADVTIISHPSTITAPIEVCDNADDKNYFYQLGDVSPIFIVFKNETENCYTGDPQKLIDQDKRVFVVENMFEDEIQELINAISEITSDNQSCQTTNIGITDE